MEEKRKDLRTPLMLRVAVKWTAQDGTELTASATLIDRSSSGACLRLGEAIPIGTNLTIKGPRGEFDYVVMNARMESSDYILGLRNNFKPIKLEE